MSRTSENETEILLGNKQLLGIFFVAAILLGVAFAGGYMVGRGAAKKTAGSDTGASTAATGTGGETHALPGDAGSTATTATPDAASSAETSASQSGSVGEDAGPPLGSPKSAKQNKPAAGTGTATATPRAAGGAFAPGAGQTFLQVAAVGRDEAEAIADVLLKKGFRAHAAPKPGNANVYRVLIGPIRDAADLSSMRESLRKTGFREVIVQRY
jgi:cell division septation protein DedD